MVTATLRQQLRVRLWRPYQAVRRVLDARLFEHRFHRRPDALTVESAWTAASPTPDDAALVDRICKAYRLTASAPASPGNSMWNEFFREHHLDLHEALLAEDRTTITRMLRDPASCDLFYGFENLCRFLLRGQRLEDRKAPQMTLDAMLALAEAIGDQRCDNPEAYRLSAPKRTDPDRLLTRIESALGVNLPVPNPFPREFGLKTERGVISYRVPQAIYQAWRLRTLTANIRDPRVVEIGPGLGRTAFYARQLGIRDYTLVDVPISCVAQAYFLGRTLGSDTITLEGEAPKPGSISIVSPESFLEAQSSYDVALNADSLTELDQSVAAAYVGAMRERTKMLLSMNHEANAFTVADIVGRASYRFPCWLRRGYVEELFEF